MNGQQIQESTPVEKIFVVLESETELCQQLVDLLDQEQTALTAMDLKGLLAISSKKHSLVERILRFDLQLQENARLLLDKPEEKFIRLSALEEFVSGLDLVRLRDYREKLIQSRRMIHDCNVVNKKFAQDTLGYLDDAISLISGSAEKKGVYQERNNAKSRTKGAANAPRLISQEV
ncbi:MAG: flagellar protein FlgN [Proteobacteria bacterium]|nr:flagellar protein FlgN [Pseudomonadota bacterium]MBU1716470.1 flagellar protein FlgN [Pseudomonadota bacterium]